MKELTRAQISSVLSASISIDMQSINPELISSAKSRIIDELVAMMRDSLRAKKHVHVAVIASRNALSY